MKLQLFLLSFVFLSLNIHVNTFFRLHNNLKKVFPNYAKPAIPVIVNSIRWKLLSNMSCCDKANFVFVYRALHFAFVDARPCGCII